jgi:C1A family cysteine protease
MKKLLFMMKFTSMMFLLMFFMSSCEEMKTAIEEAEEQEEQVDDDEEDDDTEFGTGLDHEKEKESLKTIPQDLSLVTLSDANIELGSEVLLTDYVPPVRSQGAYGTCTAWATGYYARTIMYAREHNLTKADLEDDRNVFSPLDVYLAMDNRAANCGGSWPGSAFEVMQERGIATFATAPYENLGNCDWKPKSNWTSEAASYKIESYRVVDHESVEAVKSYLQMGRPVQVSCVLGLNFGSKRGGEVMYTDDYSAPPEEHGRHAMCCVGYDDNKGANGAFLIVNSWGDWWGDNGYVWVDYDFFTSQLATSAYVIEGDKGGLSEEMFDETIIDPSYQVNGKDLIAIELQDQVDNVYDDDRYITYNVFNRGNSVVPASDDWNIVYYYYNAYDPENDFGMLVYDYYTDDVGKAYSGQMGDFADVDVSMESYGEQNWWNYIDVPAGTSVATAAMNNGTEYNFTFGYNLPADLTGEYYFVLFADGFNTIEEQYEQNNFIFFTGKEGKPVQIENGEVDESSLKSAGARSKVPADLKRSNPNAYTIDEIKGLIQYQKRAGILDVKASQFLKNASSRQGNFRGKRIVPAK